MGQPKPQHKQGDTPRARGSARVPTAHLARLEAARNKVAQLVIDNPRYGPIFQRLEREIELEHAKLSDDLLVRARAVVAQNAMGERSSATISNLPPSP
ncbi:hypothetical protein [Thioclava indica]|uniref:hypothetical protein n=1 Tax=Thioclava indica TaxID=1353528 RepID=UPI0012DD451C|nr:hypothetical protein [Thioclava indica]